MHFQEGRENHIINCFLSCNIFFKAIFMSTTTIHRNSCFKCVLFCFKKSFINEEIN